MFKIIEIFELETWEKATNQKMKSKNEFLEVPYTYFRHLFEIKENMNVFIELSRQRK
jgi:hypothetical protein